MANRQVGHPGGGSTRRRLILVAAGALVLAVLAGTLVLHGERSSYGSLRLAHEEEIPGSLGFVLEPPPDGYRPIVTPDRALRIAAGPASPPPGVHVALASVSAALLGIGGGREVPVWALVARKICYFASKGDLVSSARSSPANQELPSCTRRNLSVVLVDAQTGKALAAVRGYDLTGVWEPSTASS